MGNIAESTPAVYAEHVYQVENGDPATGGASGTFVLPSKALADRTKWLKGQVEALDAAKAPLASPALTGVPTAPTAADGTSTTQLATTAFVASALAGGAIAYATESLAGKVELATAAETQAGADGTRAVHPLGLKSALDLKAPLASPGLTGTPTAPTAAAGTNTTQVATTAFALAAAAAAAVPPGTVIAYAGSDAPAGWLICDGASLSKTTYAALYGVIGTTYGGTSTTFLIPDYRGFFLRGLDAGRALGSIQKGSLIAYDLGSTAAQTCGINMSDGPSSQAMMGVDDYTTTDYPGVTTRSVGGAAAAALKGTTGGRWTGVTRPTNRAVNYCIKY